eukprot:tig00000718_g3716.t1
MAGGDEDPVALFCRVAKEVARPEFEDLYTAVAKSLTALSDYDASAVERAAAGASISDFEDFLLQLLKPFTLPTEHLSNTAVARRVKEICLASSPQGWHVRPLDEISCGCARPLRRPAEASRRRSRAGAEEIGARPEAHGVDDAVAGPSSAAALADSGSDGAASRRQIPPRPSSPKPGQGPSTARLGVPSLSPHANSSSPIDRIQATLNQRLGSGSPAAPSSLGSLTSGQPAMLSPSPPQRPPSRGFRRASAPEINEIEAQAAHAYGRAVAGEAASEPSTPLSSSFASQEPLAAIRGLLHAHTSKNSPPTSAPPSGLRVPRGRRGSRSPSPAAPSGEEAPPGPAAGPAHARRRPARREHAPEGFQGRGRVPSDGLSAAESLGSNGTGGAQHSPSPSRGRPRRQDGGGRGRSNSRASSSGAESDLSGAAGGAPHAPPGGPQAADEEDLPVVPLLPKVLPPADFLPPRPGSARGGRRRTSTPSLYVMPSDQHGAPIDAPNGLPSARLTTRRGSQPSPSAARCMSPPPPQRAQAARTQTAHGTGVNFVKSRRRSVHAPLLPSVQESAVSDNAPPPLASA